MARLIETSRTQAYFKLFIKSETQIRMTEVNALPFSKKIFSLFICFASLLTEVNLLPISFLQEYFPFL